MPLYLIPDLTMRIALLFCSLVLIAAAPRAQPDRERPLIDGDFGPATLAIDYEQRRGDLRRATLSITSASKDTPLHPIEQVAVLSRTGQWIMFETFLSSGHTTGVTAQGAVPAAESIAMILIKPKRGPWHGWKVEQGSAGYTEVEWTYYDGAGNHVRSAPCAPRACFANVVDAFNQAESTASSFRMEIRGFSFGVERE